MSSTAAEIQRRDMQRQLLTLIREFAAEQSQGERRISDLKNRFVGLQGQLETANACLEAAKQSREAAEHSLRGSEVELSMADASVHALEVRTRLLQDEVSRITSNFSNLKNEEENFRDKFLNEMYELNKTIRSFRQLEVLSLTKNSTLEFLLDDGKTTKDAEQNPRGTLKDVEDKISDTNFQLAALGGKYQEELRAHTEAVQMLADLERRAALGEAVIEETKQTKELSRRTAESEQIYAALGSEIQKRFTCPNCHVNNMGAWEGGC